MDGGDAYCRHCGRSLGPAGRSGPAHGILHRTRRRRERFRFRDADGTERTYDRFEDVPGELRRRLGVRLPARPLDDVTYDDDRANEFSYEVTVEDAGAGALELLESIRECFGDLVDDSIADDA